ncbi:ribosome biogenesis protein SLX9-domain-containing protein [Fomitopsis serialis]|uniref:ribosome biogenesis protein SLX9-domain-containing protein n=1 Tax=Fomitopsis serialis TaxID=139415 RepID=UPI0020077DF5|nr:ribosome biogenesis protein SLX9-domain-containing protein [Neoantrodia serialis]KAH9937147.1 ribosome biogenesis protein SLX9-domain-containing protein [Neoantrodia serialis]
MPKAKRTTRHQGHEQSVRPTKRQFAVQDNATEHVDIGSHADASGTEILQSLAEQEEPSITLKKKEKQALKHELFVRRLEAARSPYSKSHERRLKRKAKEQVAGGLGEMQAAISALDDELPPAVVQSIMEDGEERTSQTKKPRSTPGLIGEGKGAPLSKAQRKRALQLEKKRIPMILSNPEFASNPFQTIRTHAQNTLLKHEPYQKTSEEE